MTYVEAPRLLLLLLASLVLAVLVVLAVYWAVRLAVRHGLRDTGGGALLQGGPPPAG